MYGVGARQQTDTVGRRCARQWISGAVWCGYQRCLIGGLGALSLLKRRTFEKSGTIMGSPKQMKRYLRLISDEISKEGERVQRELRLKAWWGQAAEQDMSGVVVVGPASVLRLIYDMTGGRRYVTTHLGEQDVRPTDPPSPGFV
ncbi:hypothetical protein Tco_1051934 [Tanacetum coccineum]